MQPGFKEELRLKHLLFIGMIGLVAGCSSSEEREVSDDHQYLNSVEGKVIKVPQGFEKPVGSNDFYIPENKGNGRVGEALDLRAPVQLLALASGSRLDEDNKTNTIWLDQTNVVDDLSKFTWDAMTGYLSGQKVTDSKLDQPNTTIQTGWVHHFKESSFWSWGTQDSTDSYQYEMKLDVRPHGKTAKVSVNLTGYQRDGEGRAVSDLTPMDKTLAEVGFLNEFVYHFQILQELRMDKSERPNSNVISLNVADNAQGQQVFHSSKTIETVWAEFRVLVEGIGFKVDDVDRGVRKLFVSYQKQERGFLDFFFGDEPLPELDFADGEYIIKVTQGKTLEESFVTFYDKDEQPLPPSIYSALQGPFAQFAKKLGLAL